MDKPTPSPPQTLPARAVTPPGPRGHFLLGSMNDFRRDALNFLMAMALEYGDVVRYRIAQMPFYQINHPEGIQRVLQGNYHNYIKGAQFDVIRQIAGNGLFTSEGDFWLRQRRLMQPSFHRKQIASFGAMMTEETEKILERWDAAAGSREALDIATEMTHLTMRIVTRSLFGATVPGQIQVLDRDITTLLEDVEYRFEVPFYPSHRWPTPRNLQARAALRRVDEMVYSLIDNRRQGKGEPKHDLLEMLIQARDEETGEGMTRVQLRDEVLALFVAGHETTALALTWCFYLLSKHPEIEGRLIDELEGALGGRIPTAADLPKLPFTRMVIEETMRLYPPAWITSRQAVAEDEILGFHIPAGVIVAVSPYVMHRHPGYWEAPERFDPDRFSPERSAGQHRFAYFPFGGGPHQCIGNGFAMVEAQLILATALQKYRLELIPDHPVEPLPQVTMGPRHGMRMRVMER